MSLVNITELEVAALVTAPLAGRSRTERGYYAMYGFPTSLQGRLSQFMWENQPQTL